MSPKAADSPPGSPLGESVNLCSAGEDCAILFAKNPVPGRVKTRLSPPLTPEQACRLHYASTSDVAELLSQSLPQVRKWIFWSESPLREKYAELSVPAEFRRSVQQGESLGERMGAAFARALASGARRVVLFGSDSPTLPDAVVRGAFDALLDCDLVLGPTEDGGYYLIGCRRFDEQLFQKVEWSTRRTFEQTMANARRLDYRVRVLELWFDLDQWSDVERLLPAVRRGGALPAHMAAFLKRLETEGSPAVAHLFSQTANPSRTGRIVANRSGEE